LLEDVELLDEVELLFAADVALFVLLFDAEIAVPVGAGVTGVVGGTRQT
jgi:hypothetical protein